MCHNAFSDLHIRRRRCWCRRRRRCPATVLSQCILKWWQRWKCKLMEHVTFSVNSSFLYKHRIGSKSFHSEYSALNVTVIGLGKHREQGRFYKLATNYYVSTYSRTQQNIINLCFMCTFHHSTFFSSCFLHFHMCVYVTVWECMVHLTYKLFWEFNSLMHSVVAVENSKSVNVY